MSSLNKTFVALAAALACGASMAVTVNLTGYEEGGPATLKVHNPAYNGGAGQFKGTIDFGSGAASFLTYCTEITQTFSFGTSYSNYSVVAGTTAWGAEKAADLGRLFTAANALGAPFDAATSAVIQAAVWEIIYENSANYSFTSGSFKLTSDQGTTQSLLNAANSQWAWLDTVQSQFKVDQLYSATNQNFLVATPVPEPGSYALLLAGIAAVGFVVRRRT